MRFYQTSDLHVDINFLVKPEGFNTFGTIDATKKHQILDWSGCDPEIPLVICGDTANQAELTIATLNEAARHFRQIIFFDGNHESYYPRRRTLLESQSILREYAKPRPGVHFLEPNNPIRIGRTLIVGGNTWYSFTFFPIRDVNYQAWKRGMEDSRMVVFDKMPDVKAKSDMMEIARHVELAQDDPQVEEICVFTHVPPLRRILVGPGHKYYSLNGCYVNEFSELVLEADRNRKITSWGFGHIHQMISLRDRHIQYTCCPRGYDTQKGKQGLGQYPHLVNTSDRRSAFE